jgi:heme/copper-type cytochrome/quinol oxidase subunit 2
MRRVAILVVASAVTMGVFTGCGDGAGTASGSAGAAAGSAPAPAAPTVHTINIKVHGGKVSGDSGRVAVPLGAPIVLSVSSDVADEIHVHGYDRKAKVPAGTTGSVVFTASKPGVFEVELENSKLQLLQLQVG